MRARVACVCAILTTATGAWAAGGQTLPALNDVLARVGDYVVRYERDLSGIVAEEHYTQKADPPARPAATRRELKSDLLLVRAVGSEGYVQFRDVFEVDGTPVRDRGERLLKLFLDPSAANTRQAGRIMAESSRFNVGPIDRNINVPLLALMFMHPRYRSHFTFTMGTEDRGGVPKGLPTSGHFAVLIDVRVIGFRETGSPTIVHDPEHASGARSRGRVWVEPDTGRVLMTELIVESAGVRSNTQVSYQSEPLVGFLVPVEMREDYVLLSRRNDGPRIEGAATYSNYRQFTVKTNEQIGPVKDPP